MCLPTSQCPQTVLAMGYRGVVLERPVAAQPSHCPATEKPRLPVSMSRTIVTVSGTDLQGKCSLSAFKSKGFHYTTGSDA